MPLLGPNGESIFGPNGRLIFVDGTGTSFIERISGSLQFSNDGGASFSQFGPNTLFSDGPSVALGKLYQFTGIDPTRSQKLVHTFDNLAGWVMESQTAAGPTGAHTPQPGTDWDGHAYVRAGGTSDSIMRGYVTNIGGTWANNIPLPFLLDQVTAFGFAYKFQTPTDDGTYILGGVGDPTVTGNAPRGVYVGYEHGTNSSFYEGYRASSNFGTNVDTAPSTVQLDAEWHVGYVFADGSGSYKFSIDGETPIAIPNAHAFSNVQACVRICFAGTSHRVTWCTAVWGG